MVGRRWWKWFGVLLLLLIEGRFLRFEGLLGYSPLLSLRIRGLLILIRHQACILLVLSTKVLWSVRGSRRTFYDLVPNFYTRCLLRRTWGRMEMRRR